MNRLQWNLRYPYATEVTGYHAPIAAGGLEDLWKGRSRARHILGCP